MKRRTTVPAVRCFCLTALAAFSISWPLQTGAQPAVYNENDVKAALLPKLAGFVEWPAECFSDTNAPLVIGIWGEDPFGPTFESALARETIKGRRLMLKRFKDGTNAPDCHLLFISPSESPRLPERFRTVAGKPILTVGDSPDFAVKGGMVRFTKAEGRMRFQVNLDATTKARLKISSRFLQVSDVVQSTSRDND